MQFLIFILFLSALLHAKDFCEIRSVPLAQEFRCIEADELNGATIEVPANTTRLSREFLTLCQQQFMTTRPAKPAIVYVVDQSGSMKGVGDPNSVRDDAVRLAIDFQGSKTPGSWAGYVEFGSDPDVNSHYFPMVPLDSMRSAMIQTVIEAKDLGATSYVPALQKAWELFQQIPPDEHVTGKAVIFISDGDPNDYTYSDCANSVCVDGDSTMPAIYHTLEAMNPALPPIQGVFLGSGSYTTKLQEISEFTGGAYHQIAPSNPSGIIDLIQDIVNGMLTSGKPYGVFLGFGNDSTQANDFTSQSDGSWVLKFDHDIPLKTGKNALELRMSMPLSDGTDTMRTIKFNIMVQGDSSGQSGVGASGDFFEACSTLTTVGARYKDQSVLPLRNGMSYATLPLDSLLLIFDSPLFTGDTAWLQVQSTKNQFTYRVPLQVSAGQGSLMVPVDSLLRSAWDTLQISWQHPYDSLDKASSALFLRHAPDFHFLRDSSLIDGVETVLQQAGGSFAQVVTFYQETVKLGVDTLEHQNDSTDFLISNLLEEFDQAGKPFLIAQWKDYWTGLSFRDTIFLDYETPVIPTAALWDANGDGRADSLSFVYADKIPAVQKLDSLTIVWGDSAQDTLKMAYGNAKTGIHLSKTLPYAHTIGYLENGAGRLYFQGKYKQYTLNRPVKLVDHVGPVVHSAWLKDSKNLWVQYSEPLQWKNPKEPLEIKRVWERFLKVELYHPNIVRLDSSAYMRRYIQISGDQAIPYDSLHLIPTDATDLQGNPAHAQNPYVSVTGDALASQKVTIRWANPLVETGNIQKNPRSSESPGSIAISVLDPFTQLEFNLSDTITDTATLQIEKTPTNAHLGPALFFQIRVPQIGGNNLDGTPRTGLDEKGNPLWQTSASIHVDLFDALGQYLLSKNLEVVIDDPRVIDDFGVVQFSLEFLLNAHGDLLAQTGRVVGTGVLVARITTQTTVTALHDIMQGKDILYPAKWSHKYQQEEYRRLGIRRK